VELSGVTVDLLRRSGVRAVACNALMDAGSSSLRRDLDWLKAETRSVREGCGGLVSHGLAPRFALSCSDPLWEWIGGEDGTRTTHASESPSELAWPAIEEEGGNIRFLHRRGFLGRRTLLAHCVHLRRGEPELLASTGTSVVHCPWTNLRLGSGIADVPLLESLGVPVSLGSDGSACNNALSLAGDARLAASLSSVTSGPGRLGGAYWLNAVTASAAESLGWAGCGLVSPGCAADLVLLEPSERERDELPLAEDPLRSILEMDWPSRVRLTMTAGKVLYRDGEYPTLPSLPIPLDEARAAAASRAGLRK
jgi:5-methylthioadenosine/S-adenosylhomocysteine deaminase